MVEPAHILEAREVVAAQLPPTPLLYSEYFSSATGARVYLKLENLQRTGSFKVRGALHKLHRCREAIGPKGVVAASAGNHAQGVALAAQRLGIPATIVMPENASISKQLATRGYGGEVILAGASVAEALERARALVAEGYTFIHPFDDPDVIAGQGTVGLELLEQCEAPDEVWVPVGGGGLIAGLAVAVKQGAAATRIVGVQSEACPSAAEALRAGRPVTAPAGRSIADGIMVPRVGEHAFRILRRLVDEIVVAEESRIAMAIVQLLEMKKLLAEGAGAVALAALLAAPPERIRDKRVVVVISGGNVDLNVLDRILEQGLIRTGRILRFGVVLPDVPGALASVLAVLTRQRANILHILHDRLSLDLPVGMTRVEVEVETRNEAHIRELTEALAAGGFHTEPCRGHPL
ncbi:MAG: threonine ammonia-lyase [Deferrisomatales bacterium]